MLIVQGIAGAGDDARRLGADGNAPAHGGEIANGEIGALVPVARRRVVGRLAAGVIPEPLGRVVIDVIDDPAGLARHAIDGQVHYLEMAPRSAVAGLVAAR
jgi:hypothetical protein